MKRLLFAISILLTNILACAGASVTIAIKSINSIKPGVVKTANGFDFLIGRDFSNTTQPEVNQSALLLYDGSFLTISSDSYLITKITFMVKDQGNCKKYINDELALVGTGKWNAPSGGCAKVKLTCGYTSSEIADKKKQIIKGNFKTTEITIEYEQKSDAKEASLQDMLKGGEAGSYKITGKNLVGVKWLTDNETQATYALIKDDNGCATDAVTPSGRSYEIDGRPQSGYDQSNWLLVKTDRPIADGQCIKSITGLLQAAAAREFVAESIELENGTESFTPNVYCPTNIMGVPQQTGADNATYFFMPPKPCEYAKIVYAVYAGNGKFYAPKKVGDSVNRLGFAGGFDVSWRFNEEGTEPNLTVGGAYEFDAIVLSKTAASDAAAASRLFDTDTSLGTSDKFVVCPLNLNSNTIPTGVVVVEGNSAIASTTYYNETGVASSTPHNGINLVVRKMTDGTTQVTKMQYCR